MLYQSVNDELRSKLKNNSKSIAGGRIGYGHNEAYEKSAFVGVIMGLVIGTDHRMSISGRYLYQ